MAIIDIKEKISNKKSTRDYSSKQEKQVAIKFNGSQTKNSGATPYQKSDVLIDKFTIECKTKTKLSESITVKKDWIDKQIKESLFMGKPYWSIAFNFGPNQKNYYIIDEELFEILIKKLEDK